MAIINFESPEMFWLIVPVIIGGIYLFRKSTKKSLIISRMIVAILLVIAFASPYTLDARVSSSENPDIVLISDETASMELFNGETSTNLYEALTAMTPTTLVRLTGEETALGDAIMQYARGDNQIVLVTDGNNNQGAEIEEALEFADDVGTTVYYVEPDLETNDLSVQIKGDKTVFVGNENQFDILVTQADSEKISYSIDFYYGDQHFTRSNVVQTSRQKVVRFGGEEEIVFESEGAHTMKAVITPSGSDRDPINNEFYKTVFAVPKPRIQVVGLVSSPLAYILSEVYNPIPSDEFSNLDGTKAIVIDNMHSNMFSEADVQNLKDFLRDGHGIVVVGGEDSYNFGGYLNSSIEDILPVTSEPTDYSGGRNVILILDMSDSTTIENVAGNGTTLNTGTDSSPHEIIVANALNVLLDEDLRDANLGIIAFGTDAIEVTDGLESLGSVATLERLETEIRELQPSNSETSLDQGLNLAYERLSDPNSENEIIIISDGEISDNYDEALQAANSFEGNVNIYFIQATITDPQTNSLAKQFANEVGGYYQNVQSGERIDLDFENIEAPDTEEMQNATQLNSYPLIELNSKHFITSNVEIEGNITGFNDVTPKAGADRLIITSTGKPVLTTWRYSLGRVAALTTDNGKGGEVSWAPQLYSGNNSKLITSTINWAIGDPREETGAVVEAPDGWFGTPVEIELTMYDEGIPILKLDGEDVPISLTGDNVYEASVEPGTIGVHDLSGYPIAINYGLEYRDVGLNEDLPAMIKQYGGQIYEDGQDARANLLVDARENSQTLVRESISQKIWFLLAALVIFLGEVILRRIREIQEMKRMQREVQG